MSWNDSVFNSDKSPLDSWPNRDSDTHMHFQQDLHYSREDLQPERESTGWEKDLIEYEFLKLEEEIEEPEEQIV